MLRPTRQCWSWVDFGPNYSLWFKSEHGSRRRAYVVEPAPNHIAVGRANAALNDSEVTFVQSCGGAEPLRAVSFTTESAGKSGYRKSR
jgi:hypothetical protein